mmetsp:Transcript_32324/g.67980  ORF Transcript_32324/g.67980 Transcript_32324/m.67980 type:complete len:556 (+) Transcript_32324:157-1824(+)
MSGAVRRVTAPSSPSTSDSSSSDDLSRHSSGGGGDTNGNAAKKHPSQPQHYTNPPQSNSNGQPDDNNKLSNNSGGLFSTRGRSVLCMSLSLAIHLGGYELSRAAVMALFTSDVLGFGHGGQGGLSALPMAVGCVSPFSVALLWFYAKTLDSGGPSYALRTHTLICAGTQIVSGWILGAFDQYLHMDATQASLAGWPFSKVKAWSQSLLFLLFMFQNGYVLLLYNQHWAFISSVLTPGEGARFFAPIAGLGSIVSTLTAGFVSVLVDRFGLIGLLHMAGASYIVSALLADVAFGIAIIGGFEPRGKADKHGENAMTISATKSKGAYTPMNRPTQVASSTMPCYKKGNIFEQAYALFQRVPVLGALFLEVIVSQCLSSLVNFIYLYKLKSAITDDAMRAGWSGYFYAWINGVSGVFQFFAIPILLKHCEAHRLWIFMPALMLCCTIFTFATFRSSGLFGTSASFFAMKTMEYSLRGTANEMLYVSLDYESRYLGKKVISLIAGKFGKSAMAVALSLVMVAYGDRSDIIWYLLATATVFTLLWLISAVRLHSLIEASK